MPCIFEFKSLGSHLKVHSSHPVQAPLFSNLAITIANNLNVTITSIPSSFRQWKTANTPLPRPPPLFLAQEIGEAAIVSVGLGPSVRAAQGWIEFRPQLSKPNEVSGSNQKLYLDIHWMTMVGSIALSRVKKRIGKEKLPRTKCLDGNVATFHV